MDADTSTLTFKFDWKLAEHARFATFLNREYYSRGIWRFVAWGLILLVAASLLLGLVLALTGDISALIQLSPWIILIVLWLWFFRSGAGWVQAWQTRRHDPNVCHPFTHTLTPSGLHIKTETAEVELKWSGLHKVRERPLFFAFYYSKRCAYQLPKRAVGDDAAIAAVREYVRAHLPTNVQYHAG
jgi:hypothetical protein